MSLISSPRLTTVIRRTAHLLRRRNLRVERVTSAPVAPTAPDWSAIDALIDTPIGKREQQAIRIRIMREGKYTFDAIEAGSREYSAGEWFASLATNEEAVTRLSLELRECHPTYNQKLTWEKGGAERHWNRYWAIENKLKVAKSNVDLARVCLAFIRIRNRRDAGEVL